MPSHSKFSPSAAYRWLECQGSVEYLDANPKPESTDASEGSKAHDLAAKMLESEKVDKKKYSDDMLIKVTGYVDYVGDILEDMYEGDTSLETKIYVERGFKLKSVHPEAFGTPDAVVYKDWGAVHIIDFKYGFQKVYAEENKQLMYYALAVIEEMEIEPREIFLHIYQPNCLDDEPVSTWQPSVKRVLEFHDELLKGVKEIGRLEPSFTPGYWCQFCNRAQCKAVKDRVESDLDISLAEPPMARPDLTGLGVDHLLKIVSAKKLVSGMIKDAEMLLHAKAQSGEKIPGKMLTPKLGNRTWANDFNPKSLARKLGVSVTSFYEKVLLTAPKLEKYIKGRFKDKDERTEALEKFNDCIVRPDRDTKLVDVKQQLPQAPALFEDV